MRRFGCCGPHRNYLLRSEALSGEFAIVFVDDEDGVVEFGGVE
jgi:hypothetical protein